MPTLRTEIKLVLILWFWAIFSLGYFARFPIPGFISKIYLIALACVVAVSAWGYGSFLLRRFAIVFPPGLESVVIGTMAGFGVECFLMILAGVFWFWTRMGAVSIVAIGLILSWMQYSTIKFMTRHPPLSSAGEPPSNAVDPGLHPAGMTAIMPALLIGAGAVSSFLIAFTPPTYYDSLVYHLALPQAYVHARHWIGQPDLIYSAFPQSMEMVWTLGLLLAGDVLANLLGWIIAVLGVVAVYSFTKRFYGERTASWAAAFLSVMPAYLLLSSGGYIDVGLTTFSFLSFYVLSLGLESLTDKGGENALALLGLAGCFAGWAIGTKYTGAIPLGIGGLLIMSKTWKGNPRRIALCQAVYGGAALLVFSPWLIKNLWYVGNPVFPFFYNLSLRHLSPWVGQAAAGYFARGLTEYTPRSGLRLLALLWNIAVNGLNFGGGMDVLGDLGWAPLFAFVPALWLVKKKAVSLRAVGVYAICFFLVWGMTRPVLRFLLPVAPFLAIAAAYGYDQGLRQQTRGARLLGNAFLTFLVLSNASIFFDVSDALSLFKVPLGYQSRANYLSEKLNYFPAASFVNTLSEDSLTYVVGDQRGYYYNRPVLVTPVFNNNPLTEWANGAASPEDLLANMKARHITHLLINHSEMSRLDSAYHIFPFTTAGAANWEGLKSRLARPLFRDAHCEVLSL